MASSQHVECIFHGEETYIWGRGGVS